MGWVEILTLIISNAPAAITTVGDGISWASKVWDDWKKTAGRDEATVTADELVDHIRHFMRSSGVIQGVD
jgi:hypothetical protein